MAKYPTAAGIYPEDAARALMGRTVKKSDNDAALKAWRIDAERGLLRALRIEIPDSSSENLPEPHKGDG